MEADEQSGVHRNNKDENDTDRECSGILSIYTSWQGKTNITGGRPFEVRTPVFSEELTDPDHMVGPLKFFESFVSKQMIAF